MKTKYDWSNINKEVKFITTDADGVKCGWSKKPVCSKFGTIWIPDGNHPNSWVCNIRPYEFYPNEDYPNWKDSLEERPNIREDLEYYKTLCVAQEAEIARLKNGFDDLKEWIKSNKGAIAMSEWHGYTTEEYVDADDLLCEINRITGE